MTQPLRINPVQPAGSQQSPASAPQKAVGGPSFSDTLNQVQSLKFSNHAQKRLESRNISLSDESVSRLTNAVEKAEKRGGQSSLVMVDDLAFIVNVRDRLVVTAMDTSKRGEGVFTQIDSVVFADPARPAIDKQG
jgi:flagellar operon protein